MGAKRGKQGAVHQAKHAVRGAAARIEQEENVFMFVPNLIGTCGATYQGYARVILAGISLYYMRDNPRVCTVLYGISCLLDAFDGMAARRFNQSTKFGAVLDMVTDRCTTACLLCFLAAAYPRCALLFQFLITLDFSSHYIHMYATLVTGNKSHKAIDSSQSRILSKYYTDTRVLFVFCAANEIFFVCLYLMDFYQRPLNLRLATLIPQSILTPLVSHKGMASYLLYTYIPSLTWPQIVGALTFPICAGKQVINAVQFWKAAKALTDSDLADRKASRGSQRK